MMPSERLSLRQQMVLGLTGFDVEPTTTDFLDEMDERYFGPGGALRSLRDAIPESGRTLDPRAPDESLLSYWSRIPNALSDMDMARGGLNTMANWLQGTPEIGPDTLAPLGLSAAGMALVPKGALGSAGGKLANELARRAEAERAAFNGAPESVRVQVSTHAPERDLSSLPEIGTLSTEGRPAGSASPNRLLTDPSRDPLDHRPASSLGPEGPVDRALPANDPSSGASAGLPVGLDDAASIAAIRAAIDRHVASVDEWEKPYFRYGLRVDEEGRRLGESFPESRVWSDDVPTDEMVGGVSTIGVNPYNGVRGGFQPGISTEDIQRAMSLSHGYDVVAASPRRYLVAGYEPFHGADQGEAVFSTKRHHEIILADQAKSSLPGTVISSADETRRAQMARALGWQ